MWFYLLSGLFLGWSLGANDSANIFGTAVGTKMLRFKTAALLASIFVVLGAVISGAGASHTLGKLGSINALGGAFTVALAAGITVSWMTKLGLPVSTTQAIVGAIVGWDLFSGFLVDTKILTKIVLTWIVCPILSGLFAFLIYKFLKILIRFSKIHLLNLDLLTRLGLIIIAGFGAYSLGANNIANVMGVFINANPFRDLSLGNIIKLTSEQVLFLIGGLAIVVGIWTYSYKVIKTVGSDLLKLSPISAFVVVLSESLVLFIFASESLERFLMKVGLPTIPLVPVSSSQAVVGGVVGVGVARGGGRAINLNIFKKIVWGWIMTPITAGIISFFSLFFMQNVFQIEVYKKPTYTITTYSFEKLKNEGIPEETLKKIYDKEFHNARKFKYFLKSNFNLSKEQINKILKYSLLETIRIDTAKLFRKQKILKIFSKEQIEALKKLQNAIFIHKWQIIDTLSKLSKEWRFKENVRKNRLYNKKLKMKYEILFKILKGG